MVREARLARDRARKAKNKVNESSADREARLQTKAPRARPPRPLPTRRQGLRAIVLGKPRKGPPRPLPIGKPCFRRRPRTEPARSASVSRMA
eukprot:194449-Hanusia_phi.AAC.1